MTESKTVVPCSSCHSDLTVKLADAIRFCLVCGKNFSPKPSAPKLEAEQT